MLTRMRHSLRTDDRKDSDALSSSSPSLPSLPSFVNRAKLLHYSLQLGCYFTTVYPTECSKFSYSDITDDFIWNHAAFLATTSDDVGALLDRITLFYKTRDRAPCFYVSPLSTPQSINHVARDRGFEAVDSEAWMFLEHSQEPSSSRTDFALSQATTDRDLEQFCGVLARCFRPDYADAVLREHGRYQPHKDVLHLLVRDGGEAIAIGTLYRIGDYAALHNIATDVSYRRQGVARAIVKTLTERAASFGASVCYLQCEEHMETLYNRFGFTKKLVRIGYVLQDAS